MNEVLVGKLRTQAQALDFDDMRITHADAPHAMAQGLYAWLDANYHGDMAWMAAHAGRRAHPRGLWKDAQSIIMLAVNYAPTLSPLALSTHAECGMVSVYARGRDYHAILKKRLKKLARWFVDETGAQVKIFVDTAPLMEKPLAQAAGLGWQGKHTNLVSKKYGSWLFLGSIVTDMKLPYDVPMRDHCGSCSACLTACPTNAFPAPYKLDARRCISYLTIEHKSVIAHELRPLMGNHIYGCDDCLAACPWNKYAQLAHVQKIFGHIVPDAPQLMALAILDEDAFRAYFAGSPIKRTGRARFVRNVLIALGNAAGAPDAPRREAVIVLLCARLDDDAPLVRGMAVWALRQWCDDANFERLAQQYQNTETNADVHAEWQYGLAQSA